MADAIMKCHSVNIDIFNSKLHYLVNKSCIKNQFKVSILHQKCHYLPHETVINMKTPSLYDCLMLCTDLHIKCYPADLGFLY